MNHQSKIYRELNHEDFDLFVTLTSDRQRFPVHLLKENISKLFCMIEKKMVGSRFNKKPNEERIKFIGFPEHINDELNLPHYHLLLRFPENIKTKYPNHKTVFKNHLETFWEKFVQPTYETPDEKFPTERVVKNRYCDVRNVIDKHIPYSVKQSNRPEHEEHIIFNNTPLR